MNNYNYGYMRYSDDIYNDNFNDVNYQSDERVNYMPNIDNYKIQFMNSNTQNTTLNKQDNILDPYQGFIRGNMFSNLYDGYKNYKIYNVNSTNERENLINQWQQYNFALVDLNLYLDTHPNDTNAIKLYNNYNNILKQISKKYESMYGPLTVNSDNNQNNWIWINSPWPWEEI